MRKIVENDEMIDHCWNVIGVWGGVSKKCEQLKEYIHCRNCPVFSAGGRKVFDQVAPVGYLKEWRKTLSVKSPDKKTDDKVVLVFKVKNEWFAISAGCLHEITEKRMVHSIPRNINKNISGVVNIGGEVRVCYSLGNILGVRDFQNDAQVVDPVSTERFVVAFIGGQYYVFPVDQIIGLSSYSSGDVSPVPATVKYEGASMLLGVISQNNNKIAVLDSDKFMENLEGIRL